MTQKLIKETTGTLAASVVESTAGKTLVGIISPGQGSSGFYPQDVIEAAAPDVVFPAGTHMYFDHPTATEAEDHPERSVLKLGAVTTENARWDAALGMLVAEWEPIAAYKELLEDKTFLGAIGVSIRATAEVEETDDGPVVKRLVEGKSIDFVTKAGRGGAILDVFESARPAAVNRKAVARGVTEATVNDKREALSTIVRDEYSEEKTWVWLRDFDDDVAYFDIESDESATWQQAYLTGDDGMPTALSGERVEVRVSTTYVPVNPAGPSTTQESSGGHMAKTQIEESELSTLRETAGRVTQLETQLTESQAKTAAAERKVAESTARTEAEKFARKRVLEANQTLPATTVDRIVRESLTDVKLTVEHVLDESAFGTVVDAAKTAEESYLAGLAEAAGAGALRGFGPGSGAAEGEVSESEFDDLFKKEA
jgi:hypothetical protein